jgi:polysaccharide biosynthesis/export protein
MRNTILVLGLAAALAGGCATTRREPAPADAAEVDAMNAGMRKLAGQPRVAGREYVIDPPDVIELFVKDNMEISDKQIVVAPDGIVSLPLIGPVKIGGRTVSEVTAELKQKYARFIRDAEVNVRVREFRSKFVYVDGEVLRPGRYAYTGSDSVINAIAQAGFLTRRAAPNAIHVARGNPNDPEIYPVRMKDIVVDDDSRTNWTLAPEDIVYVPPSFLSRVGYQIEEIFFPFSALLAPTQSYGSYKGLKND